MHFFFPPDENASLFFSAKKMDGFWNGSLTVIPHDLSLPFFSKMREILFPIDLLPK